MPKKSPSAKAFVRREAVNHCSKSRLHAAVDDLCSFRGDRLFVVVAKVVRARRSTDVFWHGRRLSAIGVVWRALPIGSQDAAKQDDSGEVEDREREADE